MGCVAYCLQPCQAFQCLRQRGLLLGKAKAHHTLVETIAIKGRQGNGCHAHFAREPFAKIWLAQIADGANVYTLKVAALAG